VIDVRRFPAIGCVAGLAIGDDTDGVVRRHLVAVLAQRGSARKAAVRVTLDAFQCLVLAEQREE
jgi:hypothetical protein